MEHLHSLLPMYLQRNMVIMPVNLDKTPMHKNWSLFTIADSKQFSYDSNIGILTGKPSGIIVIDVDNKIPERTYKTVKYSTNTGVFDWETLTTKHGDPLTPKVQTASGGYHYYFKYSDSVSHLKSKSNALIMNGMKSAIDVKTNGGYVVAPPSRHHNGKSYTWIRHLSETPMTELPQWLLQYLSPSRTPCTHPSAQPTVLFSNLTLLSTPPQTQLSIAYEKLVATVETIPSYVSDDYNDWVDVIMAIYNVCHENHIDSLQRDDLIHRFSKKSSKYKSEDVDYKIKTFHYDPSGLKFGTIVSKARLHTIEDAKMKSIEDTIDNFSQYTIANLIIQYMKDDYIYQNECGWYELLENKRWNHSRGVPTRMRNHVSKMITKVYQDRMRDMDIVNVEPKERERRVERQKLMLKQIKQSGSISFIDGVIEFMKHLYQDEKAEFDNKWHLLGFNNGVLDLHTDTFRDYQRNDFLSISTGYDYQEPREADINLLNHLMNEIFPFKDERELYKELVSTSLEGRTLEKFVVFNGSGRNGKGLLNDILLKALGNHAYVLKNTVLTSDTKNGPNPELASLEKKRLVIAREPQGKFNNSVIKEVTGGSVLNARFNHSNSCKVNLQLTLIVECNTKPKFMEDISDGEANRLIDILFRCHYTEDKALVDASNYIYEAKREYKNDEFQDRMKHSMIKILRENYKEYKARDYTFLIPESIKQNTMNYLKHSSDFLSWFNESYERSEEPSMMVSIKDIFERYRMSDDYCKLDRSEKKRMTKQYMIGLFSRNVMFRKFYRERCQFAKQNKNNVLLHYKYKDEAYSDTQNLT